MDDDNHVAMVVEHVHDITGRKKAQDALHESESQSRLLLDLPLDIVVILTQPDGTILDFNGNLPRRLGVEAGKLRGESVFDFLPPEVAAARRAKQQELLDTGRSVRLEDENKGHWYENVAYPVFDSSGRITKIAIFGYDVTARRQAEEKTRTSLREKELLLREIHHRVKNNLALISSMLTLQRATLRDQKARQALEECNQRVRTMAMIDTKLYQLNDLARIDFGAYARDLVKALSESYVTNQDTAVEVPGGQVFLDIDMTISLGLILNELFTNAVKHAFPDGRKGLIRVAPSRVDGTLVLTVSDNGVGFPEHIDFRNTDSLGMQLVIALVEQLEGTIELHRDNGTEFRITFEAGE